MYPFINNERKQFEMCDLNEFLQKSGIYIDSDVENIMYKHIDHVDSTDFLLLEPHVIDFLGFKDDKENMVFIIENMEGIKKGNNLENSSCNFVLKDGNIYIHKKYFQHFVIISDTSRIRQYLINFNRLVRKYNALNSTSNPLVIKELTETNYKKCMKCFEIRDDLISFIRDIYAYMDYQKQYRKKKMCEYCALIEELNEDINTFETQWKVLTVDFNSTYCSLKRLLSVF